MRVRHRPAMLCAAAVLALGVLSACGTGVAGPPSTVADTADLTSSSATSVARPSGPVVTVPGLTSSDTADPTGATAPTTGTSPATTTRPSTPTTDAPVTTVTRTTPAPATTGSAGPASTVVVTPDPTTVTTTVAKPPSAPPTTSPLTTSRTTTKAPTTTRGGGTGGGSMTKKVVVIDPGHNGANGAHPEIVNQQVDAGFGQTKPCNTTGTSTDDGYDEHVFNWKVAVALKAQLEAKGITVVMTRSSDDGVGPCVNKRAAIGNDNNAAAVISIHGDGDETWAEGFYVMTAGQPPAGAAVAAESSRLASDVRDGLAGAGLKPNNHLGSNGIWDSRTDLAGLNLSKVPTVMIEAGNMRNAADAALMSSSAGQQQVADGLAAGVVAYLIGG